MSLIGIDVSEHQGYIDWEKVKNSGEVGFVIIRAGYGQGNMDKQFTHNAVMCEELKIPFGVYWFSYATNPSDAKAEAEFCCDICDCYNIEYPVCFDFEYDSDAYAKKKLGRDLTNSERSDIAKAFLDYVIERNYYAMLYTNLDYLNKGFREIQPNYGTWLASWGSFPDGEHAGIWQYSSKGAVDGINGYVDMNTTSNNYPALIKTLFNKNISKNDNSELTKNEKTAVIEAMKDALATIENKVQDIENKVQDLVVWLELLR